MSAPLGQDEIKRILLIADTSCETRNQFLDRATLVENLANSGCPAF